jgi:predicted secreted protein
MLKVNEDKFFREIQVLEEKLAEVQRTAREQVVNYEISDENKRKIYDILVDEYSKNFKNKLDYLKAFVVEVVEPVGEEETE